MVDESLASTSNLLFNVAFFSYIAAMLAYFFRLAFTRISPDGVQAKTVTGRRVGLAATVLATAGAAVHLGSVVTRGLASGHVPWGNMYEYSSAMALLAVVVGLVVVQRRLGYGHLMGFVIAGAVLMMTSAILLVTEPGPLVPALDSYWIKIHTSAAMGASSIFIVGFVATALYLVKDTAERRVARSGESGFTGSTVGAAHAGTTAGPAGADTAGETSGVAGLLLEDDEGAVAVASPLAQRQVLSPVLFPLVPGLIVAVFVGLVFRTPAGAIIAGSAAALLGTASWYAVPFLPPAASLDTLAYRVVAFGFPVWTFAVMAGAIWAEEAWGRYWGWDPKETGSFVTWVLYAAYLHARSTHGWRGRRAAVIGIIAFVALMITYYAVNLWIVGLHSYAGV